MYVLLTEEFNGYHHNCDEVMNKGIEGEYVIFELGEGVDEMLGEDEEFIYNDWYYLTEGVDEFSHLSEGKLEIDGDNIVITHTCI